VAGDDPGSLVEQSRETAELGAREQLPGEHPDVAAALRNEAAATARFLRQLEQRLFP
jgi:hypothetical protein